MPGPITTSGFQVAERPRVDYMDPRLMVPQYSQLLPQIKQGLDVYGNFQQIADQAKARPIIEQLRQIALNKAGQPIESVTGTGIEEVNRYPQIQSQDDNGNPIMEQPAGIDTFQTETVEVFDPVSGLKRLETRRAKPLQTMEQGMYQQAQIESIGALADQRGRGKTYESEALISGYTAALEAAANAASPEEAAAAQAEATMYKSLIDRKASRGGGGLPEGVTGGRELEKMAARVGIPLDRVSQVASTPAGARGIAKLANIQKYIAGGHSFIPANMKLTPEEQAAVEGAAAGPAPSVTAGVPSPKSRAEYDALPPGTKYVAPDGQIKIKK